MERLKVFLKQAFSYPMQLKATHPLTALCVIATTVMFAVYVFILACIDYSDRGSGMEFFFCVCLSVLYFSTFSLCIESIRLKRSKNLRYVLFAVSGILSLLMGFILSDFSRTSHRSSVNFLKTVRTFFGDSVILMYISGLMAVSVLLAIYFSYNHNVHQRFNEHVINSGGKIFLSSIIYGVIQLGVLFLTVIVTLLLYDDAFEFIGSILILINGLFFVPAVLCALTRDNEKANMFIEVIVRYISLIIVLLAFCIIYIYMIKLVATASVPSNSVYAILTTLFIVSMFISYMCTSYEEKGPLQKFAYYCPVIFAPFILMQCYTVFVRIGQYGLTPKRYMGIAFIIFETIYIIYYMITFKRQKQVIGSNLLLIIASIVVITVFIPGINATSLSVTLARHTLSSYMEKAASGIGISPREYMRTNAAYDFLTDKDFGDKAARYFADIDTDMIETLREKAKDAARSESGRDAEGSEGRREFYGWYSTNITKLTGTDGLDISEYNRLVYVLIDDGVRSQSYDKPVDPAKLVVTVSDNRYDSTAEAFTRMPTADLSDFVSRFIALSSQKDAGIITDDEFNAGCKSICMIDINENVRLYITDANISHNIDDKPIDINIEGYLLMK